jgi:hypothetical protein
VPAVLNLDKILKQSKILHKSVFDKLLILPPFEGSTSGKEEFVELESFYTPYPESRYKYEEKLEFLEGVEYIPL